MSQTDTRKLIVKQSQSWLGTPYHHRARVKGAGVDCAQLLIAVYGDCGLIAADFDVAEYPMDWHMHRNEERYLNHVLEHAHKVDVPLEGDMALFKFGRTVSHAAIVVEWPFVVHAYRPDRACVLSDVSKSDELTARLVGFYRLNQFKDAE